MYRHIDSLLFFPVNKNSTLVCNRRIASSKVKLCFLTLVCSATYSSRILQARGSMERKTESSKACLPEQICFPSRETFHIYVIHVYSLRIYSRILLQRNNSREKYLTSFVNILRIPSRLVFSFRAFRLKEDFVRDSLKRSSKKKFSLTTDQLH